jgi:hypothetical protein
MKNQIIGATGGIYSDNNLINLFYSYSRIFSQLKNIKQSDIKKIFQKLIKLCITDNNYRDITEITEILNTKAAETFKIDKNNFDKLKKIAENEINILDKLNIARFLNLGNNNMTPIFFYYYNADKKENTYKKTLSDLSSYLNINYIREKIYSSKICNAKFVFITSSRYKNAGIFKFNDELAHRLNNCLDFNELNENHNAKENTTTQFTDTLYFIGTASEAENGLIKNYDKIFKYKKKIILAPHYPMTYFLENYPQYSEFSAISAINPFETNFKHCYNYRNNLISNITSEIIVLYLSKNSSLNNLIKKFKKLDKNVNIIENFIENNKIAAAGKNTNNIVNIKDAKTINILNSDADTDTNADKINRNENIYNLQYIEKEILNFLYFSDKISDNINITVDDIINELIKIVRQINTDTDTNNELNQIKKNILQSISLMEIKGIIKREPSGVIKKI